MANSGAGPLPRLAEQQPHDVVVMPGEFKEKETAIHCITCQEFFAIQPWSTAHRSGISQLKIWLLNHPEHVI